MLRIAPQDEARFVMASFDNAVSSSPHPEEQREAMRLEGRRMPMQLFVD
jgi:hypothetical protein